MGNFLTRMKRHPFPVVAHFERVVAASFAFPAELLRPLLPAPLSLDTYEGFGFVTIALVWTRGLRPAGLPAFLGQDFFLAGYRIFARLRDADGRRLRGLKILRSETDKARMAYSGNLLTHYNYRHIHLTQTQQNSQTRVQTHLPDGTPTLDMAFDLTMPSVDLPAGSPFPDWRTARLFAGPMPFTFDDEGDGRFVVIEGRRSDWTPRPVFIHHCGAALFNEPPFRGTPPILANAFTVENIPYRWERGRLVAPMLLEESPHERSAHD
jgi:hypothetical protein